MSVKDPTVVAQYNKGTVYLNKKNWEKAMKEFKDCLRRGGSSRELHLNLGNCYKFMGNDRKAFEHYSLANDPKVPYLDPKLRGNYGLALNNLGLYHFMYDRNEEAIEIYNTAIADNELFYDAYWNKATATLKLACSHRPELFAEGWELYGHRFTKTPPVTLKNDKGGMSPWDGSYVESLVVLAEQGIGDNIMWGRFLGEIIEQRRVGKLWVQANHDMQGLFKNIPGLNVCFNVSETDALNAIPMCELARFFAPSIPNGEWLKGKYAPYSFPTSDKLNVGIVFAGSTTHNNNAWRSVPMHRFHKFASLVNLYCLSPGFKSTKYIKGLDISSWDDTAKYVAGLDLVISIDTSVVHLAGTMGKECWMFQPFKETDFRWGTDSNGSWNCWYPSVSVYRNPQDWDFVFANIERDLKDKCYG